MSPISLDLTSDFHPSSRPPPPTQRTLLLAPPSLAADATRVSSLFTSGAFDRATTDLHMLDRLAAGLVALPPSTYDLVLVLAGDTPTPQLDRALWALLVPAVKPGGKVSAEDGRLSRDSVSTLAEAREAVLAGLVAGEDGFVKPDGWGEEEAVPIIFGLRKKKVEKKENAPPVPAPPLKGVGFVDFSDDLDLDADDDDGLIDEDALLTEADLRRPVPQPPECAPQPGKKRRACKDCTCGLAERLEAEDKQRRDKADKDLGALKLASADLNELDFTIKGKTGSCNSCYLGDAFRCADCPYTGLPAFKPGEEVKILDNVAQF
ncbi:cytokine-induced anti-apoptosis inhibitor 1, Fe-S biogenesis-domain-containing protein [Schizothecium vesticola]|uniref:Cytokine-induced anti-apoptosis inhibitor 1, Fe-S biogenesis-domain-containing protein n=1 Tax=Schizothecium vesticola TaxID=314040 RepID=A0AA40F731_9PEZI|nr:cytokine-induced anti-apoptosis inhibitor 1, Fe-S biogenesis-domain-containing protein [Schizothecium vesticola]